MKKSNDRKTNKVKVDVRKIKNTLIEKNIPPKQLCIDARISEATWHRIKRDKAANFHVAVTIATCVLDISPWEIIIEGKGSSDE